VKRSAILLFSLIKRDICIPQQSGWVITALRSKCSAKASRAKYHIPRDDEWPLETLVEALSGNEGIVSCLYARYYDRKLVASEPRYKVRRSATCLHPFCDLHQKFVARQVTQSVVDELEVVEIDANQ
jgi:hypothetical protein